MAGKEVNEEYVQHGETAYPLKGGKPTRTIEEQYPIPSG
jgi:hypothetical protein